MKVWRDSLQVGDHVWFWFTLLNRRQTLFRIVLIRPHAINPRRHRYWLSDGVRGVATDLWNLYPSEAECRPALQFPPQ